MSFDVSISVNAYEVIIDVTDVTQLLPKFLTTYVPASGGS